ncbi:MAG: energy-coupling factor ABC transporter permease [Acidobacteria bacterium]|nr:energy-coupling factor ABC transporter permease [Acidobacteriota bacterium]
MHIPYGLLSAEVSVVTGALAAPAVGFALWRVRRRYEERTVALMGMLGAYVFAAQMINFPVAAGTSGHLLGAALAAFLLGPAPAMLILGTVLLVQALLFQDGAITALGANALNMAVLGPLTAWGIWTGWRRLLGGRLAMAGRAVAAVASIVVPAAACAVEIAVSGLYPLTVALGAMAGVHTVIGVAEAAITVVILRFLAAARPDLLAPAGVPGGAAHAAAQSVE